MQAFLIILTIVFFLILLGVNIFLLRLYIHPQDKPIFNSVYAKVLIILGLTLCQAQALMIPLDVANNSANSDRLQLQALQMGTFWLILYCILLGLVTVGLPYAIFFYETDPERSFIQRLCRSFAYLFVTLIVSCMVLFISWNFLKFIDLPSTQITILESVPQEQTSESVLIQNIEASLAVYIVAIISFIGWVFVAVFGGVGLFALPLDFINEFRNRPRVRKSDQMMQTKNKLVEAVKKLIEEGENITEFGTNYQRNQQAGCLQKFKGDRKINTQFTRFKVKYHILSQQFSVFNLQLKIADANPIIPYLKLFLGFIFALTSLFWIIQIIFGNILPNYRNQQPLFPFLDQMLANLDNRNVGLFALIFFAYLCMYMMWCVQKGSIKFGMRVPFCCRFYPLKQRQTALNAFMVNVLFLILASVGVTQLCIDTFPIYTRNAQIQTLIGVTIKYMRFYGWFARYCVFPIAMLAVGGLAGLYALVTCNKKPRYMREYEMIREYHRGQIEKIGE